MSDTIMMVPDRLKTFTDGVLAIIITIMVLELRVPHDAALTSLRPLVRGVLSYALSVVYLVIYWNNHHHLLHVTRRVTGGVLWANAHLLKSPSVSRRGRFIPRDALITHPA